MYTYYDNMWIDIHDHMCICVISWPYVYKVYIYMVGKVSGWPFGNSDVFPSTPFDTGPEELTQLTNPCISV